MCIRDRAWIDEAELGQMCIRQVIPSAGKLEMCIRDSMSFVGFLGDFFTGICEENVSVLISGKDVYKRQGLPCSTSCHTQMC